MHSKTSPTPRRAIKLLDTTFLIHYWAGTEAVREYLEAHENTEFATTTLNIKEIAVGRKLQGKLDTQEILTRFEWTTIIPFRTEHAVLAGELEATLHETDVINRDRINALAGDVLIAAVAKDAGATVVTKNTGQFELFDGVAVESY